MKRYKKVLVLLALLTFGIGYSTISYAEENDKATTESSATKDSKENEESGTSESQQPYNYKAKEMEEKIKAIPPASATGKKFDGQGTVTDFSTSGSKAFYTITDKDSNVYYLIIDLEKTDQNVYFVSDVQRAEMQGLAEGDSNNQNQNVIQNPNSNNEDSQNVTTPAESEKNSNNNGFLFLVLGVAVIGFIAYYFLKFKKNKAAKNEEPEDLEEDEEDEEEFYGDEEISEETENEGETEDKEE
ncbi:CD1107 family mobile element protein [Enterococcus sp. AZ196]|uniref:CD1107 family mobile element protein n=1 Tax=Enterococcus sp. AZ196 TaxID=2774659 RepID=UPI003D2CB2FF